MRLYLMQHGLATSKEEDPDRPLTDEGRAEVERVARAASRVGIELDAIHHSGKLRARQTAEILAERLQPGRVEEREGISPTDDPSIVAEEVAERSRPLSLVGHLPHLERLASLLAAGDPDASVVAFRNAALVCLERDGEGAWGLRWILHPELVPPA
ncbi:MAG: phosphohistidine phosphatase SixA [Gemmatimonadota bacterium]|nr:phosphohistidine phosphatase SixA [Gemmatimonadota bacterium]